MTLSADRQKLLSNNILQLNQVMLQQLQQQISLAERHINDYLAVMIEGLGHEQQSILQQQEELKQELGKMPNQWITEKLLALHLSTNGTILEQISSLIETKNIADNFDTTLSAPFDPAKMPLHPNPTYLWLFVLVGGVIGAFITFSLELIRSTAKGVIATEDNLALAGQHVSGRLSQGIEPKREVLRRMIAQLCPSQSAGSVLLLNGEGDDYSKDLAALLAKRSQKVLLLPISFDKESKEKGLLQYLENPEQPPKIFSEVDYDYISSGGETPFANELLQSDQFRDLLENLMFQYDWIIAISKVSPNSSEADSLMRIFNRVAITVIHERLYQLQKYFGYKDKKITYLL
jgi:hypothetical protein